MGTPSKSIRVGYSLVNIAVLDIMTDFKHSRHLIRLQVPFRFQEVAATTLNCVLHHFFVCVDVFIYSLFLEKAGKFLVIKPDLRVLVEGKFYLFYLANRFFESDSVFGQGLALRFRLVL